MIRDAGLHLLLIAGWSALVGACASDGGSGHMAVDEGVYVSQDDTYKIVAGEIATLAREECGATFNLEDGNRAASGVYVVGVYPEPARGKIFNNFPQAGDVLAFIDANADLLEQEGHTLGAFCEAPGAADCKSGAAPTCYLDVSRETATLTEAARLARACNQKSVAWLAEAGVKIIDQEAGQPFGDGKGLAGEALKPCVDARQK